MMRSVSMSSPGTYTAVPVTRVTGSSAMSGHHAFLVSEYFTGVGDAARDRRRHDHDGAHEDRPARDGALAADEVPVGAAGAQLVTLELIGVHGEAHAAARRAPFEAGIAEDLVDAAFFALEFHEGGAG